MNPTIAQAQQALNQMAAAGLAVDGKYGPRTRAAIIAFQRARGLKPDGILGAATKAALGMGTSAPVSEQAKETTPPQETIYINLRHGGELDVPGLTGVFFPKGYKPDEPLDCIVWLHGHRIPKLSIRHYWRGDWQPKFRFREALNTTGKNVVLIGVTLGPKSQAGNLVAEGGFDAYLDRVFDFLRRNGPLAGKEIALRHMVLACHSGGGSPMRQIALKLRKYAPQLRECWGFDCMYNWPDPGEWSAWAKANPDKRLYVYWAHTTRRYSTALAAKNMPNISVAQSETGDHNGVPIHYWQRRIGGFRGTT